MYVMLRYTVSTSRYTHGFSLIELSVVLAIISLIVGSIVSLTSQHMKTDKYESSLKKLTLIDEALRRYVIATGELPCPASRLLVTDDPNFGTESHATCSGDAPSGTTDVGSGTIRIGTVPVRELNLPDHMMFDAWDSRITYVMVKSLGVNDSLNSSSTITAPASDASWGGIRIYNALNSDVFDRRDTNIAPSHFIAYALISHGENMGGARNKLGNMPITCPTISLDAMNCDDTDYIFRDTSLTSHLLNTNANYFDDLVLWQPTSIINPNLR
jgi:prepilin-type N-terminal cleavage/methylation domain-containing protein